MARLVDLEPIFEMAKLAGFGTPANLLDFLRMQPVIDAVPKEDYQKLLEFVDDTASFFPACLDCEGKTPLGERTDKCVYAKLSLTDEEKVYCIKRGIKNILKIQEENRLLRTTTVSQGLYDQVAWERDVAIDQLKSYGVQFGEKAELQRVNHGKWVYKPTSEYDGYIVCSNCDVYIPSRKIFQTDEYLHTSKYCPHCGARMDGE